MGTKKARNRKRQTTIDFSRATKSSPATRSSAVAAMENTSSESDFTFSRSTSQTSKRVRKRNKPEPPSDDEFVAETERGMSMGKPVGSTRGMFDGSDNGSDSDDSQSSEENESRSSEEEVKAAKLKVVRRSRKRRRERTPSESDNERDEPTVKVISRREQPRIIEIGTDSEDERRNKRRKKAGKRRKVRDNTSEEEQTPPRSHGRRLKSRKSQQSSPDLANRYSNLDEEDMGDFYENVDEDENDEQDELKEDLAFLRSSPLPDRGKLRSTHNKPKNKRQEALEALKRRRAATSETPSTTPGRRRAVVVETDSESELEIVKEEPNSDLENLEQLNVDDEEQESDREANALDMFQEDQEDEQFIDDDVEDTLGEPAANDDLDEMRLAFSLSRAKTKDLFRNAVEWMVMKKIHPGFDMTKNFYTLTFRKLDDEVKGLAGSKYTSAAWTTDFTRALRARPEFLIHDLSIAEKAIMAPHCDACNRTNHQASFELMLTGLPYNPETLEPVATDDSESDSDSDSNISSDPEPLPNGEKAAYNFMKERIPPETHRFPLGSTCKANAQVAHTLIHWRYHLYQWVKDYLKAEGHLTAEKLVKREGWSDRRREKKARKIVDKMEESGHVRSLYNSYKTQLQAAMETDNDYRNGWGKAK
ncbi:transcription factor iiic [Pyrenophora seminiperda CCB06]|uniref:Transcription factor iiic n=1 Tax=Pyrenophora seminiperda CCB06 TaxID=1302712 RepID=A0A3M7M9K3_9PLEO|nr:transcription factor iiic [Pyrenophora seminiperda CCB06]